MKIVQFWNGTYGLRKGWLIYSYLDFNNKKDWWSKDSVCFKYCQTTIEEARAAKRRFCAKDKVVE